VIPQIRELDRDSIVAPLGFRFWDGLTNQVISDRLLVWVYPMGDQRRSIQAYANRIGIFAVRHVPGLRVFESGAGDADFWAAVHATQPLMVEVTDLDRRFVPFSLRTWAPQRGLLAWPELSGLTSPLGSPLGSPFGATSWVPLFSAPTRAVPGGVGVIRAQLYDPALFGGQGGPAAWAVVEVDLPGQAPVRSIADDTGRVAILFAYPTPPVESLAGAGSPLSPLAGPPPPRLTNQTWTLKLRAAYRPLNMGPGLLPDLDDVLSQPGAVMWADLAQTRVLTETQLQFGRETVLRSLDDSGRTRPSVVFVRAGSPQ
jgi:hypothetical protein